MEREISIASQLKNLENVRVFLEDLFESQRLNFKHFNRVYLGLSEAVSNSIVHGNSLDQEKRVYIQANIFENEISLKISDEGGGFSAEVLSDPLVPENIRKESGRGILLMRNIADELEFLDGGKEVFMRYRFE